MSSTSNVQDLLVNVFRPTYTYDSNLGFVPSLVLSNVTEVITSRVRTDALIVSDSNLNTYIGCNAGVNATDTASNVGIGYSALGGAVNCSNNVALGAFALNGLINSDCNVAIGTGTDVSSGSVGMRNVLIGTNVRMGGGSNNILIGVDISRGTINNQLQIGQLLYGDLCSGYIGINTSAPAAALDISGVVVFRDKVGFQNPNPDFSLDVNGDVYANGTFIGGDGTVANPLYTFSNSRNTGMYVPTPSTIVGTVDLSTVGTGAFGIATNGQPAAIFTTSKSYFMKDLDVSGTFTARSVNLSAFAVSNGTVSQPTVTFTSDNSTGLFLIASNVLGVSTGGVRRMAVLSNGDISMGRILVSDISASGAIFSSSGSNSIGGVTLSNGFVITSGTTTSSNLLVPGFLRNADPATTLDISDGNISNSALTRSSNFRGSNGSVSVPTYSFVSDASTGLHLVGGSALGFDTSGVLRMCLSGGFLGIGTAAPRVALDVSGDISANVYNGPGGTAAAPHYTFSDDRTTGVFFPGANIVAMTAGGVERMRISNAAVGIGTTAPTNALDVSGVLRVIGANGNITFSNGTVDISGTQVFSSSGALSNAATTSNSIGGVVLSNSNVQIGNGTVAAPSLAFVSDASSGLYRPTTNQIGFVTAGVQRLLLSNSVLAVGRTPVADASLVVQTASNAYVSTGRVYLGDAANSTPAYGAAIIEGLSNGGSGACDLLFYSRAGGAGAGTDPRERMRIVGQTGNVGIGTTAPTTSLDVSGNTRVFVKNGTLTLQDASTAFVQAWTAFNEYGNLRMNGYLTIHTAGTTLADAAADSNRKHVLSGDNGPSYLTGTVGIGTSAPNSLNVLDVSGRVQIQRTIGGNTNLVILADSSYGSTSAGGRFGIGLDGVATGTAGGSDLVINTYDNSGVITVSKAVTVKRSNGYVGIGTSNPTSRVHVYDASIGTLALQAGTIKTGGSNVIEFQGTDAGTVVPLSRIVGIDAGAGASPYRGDLAFVTSPSANTYLERMRIRYDGAVGLGTTAPRTLLDLSGEGSSILIGGTTASTGLIVQGYSNTGYIRPMGTAGTLYLGGSNTTSVTINSNGLGVNGVTPTSTWPLEVAGAGQFAGGIWSRESASNTNNMIISTTATQGVIQSYKRDPTAFNDIIFQTTNNSVAPTRMTIVGSNGRVGISNTSPSYMLDVTADATSNAAINASTWTRASVSNVMICVGSIGKTGNVYNWSNASPAMSSSLISFVASNGTTGGYFSILKSGIWGINVYAQGQDATAYLAIDASTGTGLNVSVGGPGTLAAYGGYEKSISYVGYLSSNSGMYYKIIGYITESGNKNTKLMISFIQELPDISPTYPPP